MLGVRQGDAMTVAGTEGGLGVRFKRVDAEYFSTLDIPLVAGRAFTRDDRAGAPRVGDRQRVARAQAGGALPGRRSEGGRRPCREVGESPVREPRPVRQGRGHRNRRGDSQRACQRSGVDHAGCRLRVADAGAAPRDQAAGADARRSCVGDARPACGGAGARSASAARRRPDDGAGQTADAGRAGPNRPG